MWCCSKSAAVWGTPAVALIDPGRLPVTPPAAGRPSAGSIMCYASVGSAGAD
jgi:hypothetical protein